MYLQVETKLNTTKKPGINRFTTYMTSKKLIYIITILKKPIMKKISDLCKTKKIVNKKLLVSK